MQSDVSDEELVQQYKTSSASTKSLVADELFSRHYERVARWCYRFTGDRDSAADLAQEVFLKAHRHLDGFQGTSRFTTWLYAIARNESLNRIKRRAAAPEDSAGDVLMDFPSLGPGPEELAADASRARRVQQFLCGTLDRTERIVFTLHYGKDMPLDAITRLLRLENASGAKAHIVSAKRKLARAVQRQAARGEAL